MNSGGAPSSSAKGIASMVLATGAFVACDSCMKLVMADAPPLQVLFMRGVAASLWCLPLLYLLGYGKVIGQSLDRWVLLRAVCEVFAVMCFVIALARMPIADITAIFQIAPLLVLLGVSFIWHERIGPARMGLIALGIGGALLVAQPGTAAASPYAVFGFATAAGAAARDLVARKIPQQIPVLVASFTTLVVVMLCAGVATAGVESWSPPTPRHLVLMATSGLFLMFGHMFVFLAFRFAKASSVAPFYYSFTLWAVLSSIVVFGEMPNVLSLGGMVLILISGLAMVLLDGRRRRIAAAAVLEA
ncbi:MAG: DMT family transporter [Aestuariivirgaceae bacterium]